MASQRWYNQGMPAHKMGKRKANSLSVVLDFVDVVNTSFERLTGKPVASWIRDLREQSREQAQRVQVNTPQPTTTVADAYKVLGLPPTASLDEVKRRYKQLAQLYHPDREGGYTPAMQRLNRAYEEIVKEKRGE